MVFACRRVNNSGGNCLKSISRPAGEINSPSGAFKISLSDFPSNYQLCFLTHFSASPAVSWGFKISAQIHGGESQFTGHICGKTINKELLSVFGHV